MVGRRRAGDEGANKQNALADTVEYHGICQGIVNLRGYALSNIRKFRFAQ